jgi:two-component system, cell cycle sensor histidine kinase and response regulator CckA
LQAPFEFGKGIKTAVSRRRLSCPVLQRFSYKLLLLGIVAVVIPLVSILVVYGLFSQSLLHDLHQSLGDLQAREGQRLESQQHKLIHQQVRQKALDVAQDITSYMRNHPGQTWEEMWRDPALREVAVQPVGMVGETFLVAASEKRILLHNEKTYEGQTLEQVLCPAPGASHPDLDFAGTPGLQEFSLAPGQGLDAFCHGFLVPLLFKPHEGPELMVGAWVDPREMDLIIAQSRAIFKTALNVTGALIETRLVQGRQHLFYVLAVLGLLALLACVFLARRLTTQVTALTRAAEAFDQGNLGHRILKPGRDELGQLARTLNRMAASLNDNTISRLEWENTFNALPDPVILVDAEGRVTRLNRAAALYLDIFPEEARGSHVSEIRAPGHGWFPEQALVQALEHGKKTRAETCTTNGHSYLVTIDPCWDLQGKISGAVFVARDVTALKQMQGELAQASHFLRQLVESAPLGLTFIDPQGHVVQANSQFLQEFGYTPEDILNRHYSFLYASEAERQQVLAALKSKGEVLGHQVYLRHLQGEPVPARISIRKLYDQDNSVIGSVCLVSNISEEVSLQRQLEQAQKQEVIATLAGGLAHNFNNLLMIIMGLTSLMLTKIIPDHPIYADLMDIERQVRAGREITRKLLAFRRTSDFETQPLNLNTLVETTSDMFGRTRPDLILQKEFSQKLPAVEVDSGQIQQVLMNLLINAWQAMPQGGTITLQTRAVQLTDWFDPNWDLEPGSYVCLSVTDTGAGMAEETVKHLFEPFFTTKEPGQGSGLGLASAYRIMKNHRGAIQVTSQPGEGSTFTLFFPASPALPLEIAPEEKHIVPGQGTILVVEDEPTLRRVAGKLLERLGYQVLEATNGERALEIFAERHRDIDLVLLDMIMPGLNGLQTLARLRDLNPQIRVILCSGMVETQEENLPAGVSFVPKPVPLEILSQKVAAALNG